MRHCLSSTFPRGTFAVVYVVTIPITDPISSAAAVVSVAVATTAAARAPHFQIEAM